MICDTYSVSSMSANRRARAVTGNQTAWRSGWELLALEMIKQAIEDSKILCRYGLIDRSGELMAWPLARSGGYMTIATMHGPLDHAMLRDFWNDPQQGQSWCDLCGFPMAAQDVWQNILKHHAQ